MSPIAPPPPSALPAGPAVRFVVQGDGVDADTSMVAHALQMVRDESDAGTRGGDWRNSLSEASLRSALRQRRREGHSGAQREQPVRRVGVRVWNISDEPLVCCATDGRRDGPPHLFQAFSVADEIVPNPGPVHFDARFAHTVPWQIGWQLRPGDTLKVQRLAEGRPAGQPLLFTLSGEESQHVFVTLAAPELSAVP